MMKDTPRLSTSIDSIDVFFARTLNLWLYLYTVVKIDFFFFEFILYCLSARVLHSFFPLIFFYCYIFLQKFVLASFLNFIDSPIYFYSLFLDFLFVACKINRALI